MNSKTRIAVYKDTLHFSPENIAFSKKFTEHDFTHIIPITNSHPIIIIVNDDILDTLCNLLKEGYNAVILNTAYDIHPGGGVLYGCAAQEENIFRRTNYFKTLSQKFYPLIDTDTIYSKNVILFKTNEETGYNKMDHYINISIIASASVKNPYLNELGLFKFKEDFDMQYRKICTILKTAIYNGHNSIILNAFGCDEYYCPSKQFYNNNKVIRLSSFGCGAYNCPSKQVAELFKKAIEEYGSYFEKIVFAIKEPVNNDQQTKNNFEIFMNVFKK